MKTVVVIDATCDLPDAYVQQHRLKVLPNKLLLGDQVFSDTRDINLSLAFFSPLRRVAGSEGDKRTLSSRRHRRAVSGSLGRRVRPGGSDHPLANPQRLVSKRDRSLFRHPARLPRKAPAGRIADAVPSERARQ
ncbi:hypothetical protein E4P82_10690 [Candidatus Competibacter phosphatis]|uniref:Uncharacterized protein n=1 Tax=Candidatus Competibacter phosphatis TaxID=221280 RepID=A0ABX1TLN9_9GAMM|nr:hypothetical protein [Candidatus Competibacter phosphatis]